MAMRPGKRTCATCGRKISEEDASKYITDHEGEKYFFCSSGCKREFNVEEDT